jgi:hypothetical protein
MKFISGLVLSHQFSHFVSNMQGLFLGTYFGGLFLSMANNWDSFLKSLEGEKCPSDYSPLLKALWTEARGDWHGSHSMVDGLGTTDAAWIHAYLHRREGDISNADYWYGRANRTRPTFSVDEERKILVEYFFDKVEY